MDKNNAAINAEEKHLKRGPLYKRPLDFILALFGLIVSSPLWVVIALLIFLEDRGPVFFLQKRCGKGGTLFPLIKFRTMKYNKSTPHKIVDIEDDPRVTKVGKILRASGMDELPGLTNILIGNMSFVGPRPQPFNLDDDDSLLYNNIADIPGFARRSQVRPGLTGIAQIYAPKTTPRRNKFRYDNLYVRNIGFFLDVKLIVASFWITIRGKWERRGKKI